MSKTNVMFVNGPFSKVHHQVSENRKLRFLCKRSSFGYLRFPWFLLSLVVFIVEKDKSQLGGKQNETNTNITRRRWLVLNIWCLVAPKPFWIRVVVLERASQVRRSLDRWRHGCRRWRATRRLALVLRPSRVTSQKLRWRQFFFFFFERVCSCFGAC